jgi:hypothetical protein
VNLSKNIFRLLLVATAMTLAPASASAGTASGDGETIRFTATPGVANALVVTRTVTTVTISDVAPIAVGDGCAPSLPTTSAPFSVVCDLTQAPDVVIDAGDGDDTIDVVSVAVASAAGRAARHGEEHRTEVHGGPGNDRVRGGAGNENAHGDDGDDDLDGGSGNDDVHGGRGRDQARGGHGRDRARGGDGEDTVHGGAGDDAVGGDAGSDTVEGGDGNDTVSGGDGDDTVVGGGGSDDVSGDQPAGSGDQPAGSGDQPAGSGDAAAAGDDNIQVRDGAVDTVDCGGGRDQVTADESDVIDGATCGETLAGPTDPPAGETGAPGDSADSTAPALSRLALTARKLVLGGRRRGGSRRKVELRFSLSEAATVELRLSRTVPGVVRRGRCRAAAPRKRGTRRCSVTQNAGTLSLDGLSGKNSLPFTARLAGRSLAPGSYRARVLARDAAGNRSTERVLRFKVARR